MNRLLETESDCPEYSDDLHPTLVLHERKIATSEALRSVLSEAGYVGEKLGKCTLWQLLEPAEPEGEAF